ncbi:MAG: PDZ domain-containing protein [Planctomycetes bacterium]|nr:PDZ domain-containing protein [Planctomycetota bacterium]
MIVRKIVGILTKTDAGYWVGLNCTQASEALRVHLRLPQKRGLLVVEVVAKSPAAKAKIARHDVLLKFADKDLSSLDDLIAAVQSVKGKEATVWLIRAGKKQMLKITPKKRPQIQSILGSDRLLHELHHSRAEEFLKKYLAEYSKGKKHRSFKMRFFGPGVVLPQRVRPGQFQDRLDINITRKNGEAVKIVVKIDGKTFNANEKNLEKLPAAVRDAVKNALGQGGKRAIEFKIEGVPFQRLQGFAIRNRGGLNRNFRFEVRKPQNIEKKLDELLKQMKRLQESVEKLKKNAGK